MPEPNPVSAPPTDPAWAEALRRDFTSGAASVFLLHGLRDCYPHRGEYLSLREFLFRAFCGKKQTVMYDIGQGLSFPSPADEDAFRAFVGVAQTRGLIAGPLQRYLKPIDAIPLLEDLLFSRNGAAVIIDFVDKIIPPGDSRMMTFEERRLLTTIRRWATDPRLLQRNNFVFLIADSLGEVNQGLYGQGGGIRVVNVPLPDEPERLAYIEYLLAHPEVLAPNGTATVDLTATLALKPTVLAQNTNGLALTQIAALLRSGTPDEKVDLRRTSEHKRRAIEMEIGDLVEFMAPARGLEAVGGVEKQKELLLSTAAALRKGHVDVVPKGILLTGPPGCGKTFCMECFAHDCEIPFVQLKNVFSKYVGATESNLEKLFHYLEALAPVFVFIDEFDQSYGRRVMSDGDSGVSRRVFAMFNAFLSDESHQGKIVFGAATNRPDLIDPSTIRAGRFDLKIPFPLPNGPSREAILQVTLRTLGLKTRDVSLADLAERTAGYSGADLKEIVRIAQRKTVFDDRSVLTQEDLAYAVQDYLSPNAARAEEIRLMELLAIANTTSRSMLTPDQLQWIESGELYPEIERIKLRLSL
ncbi:MAG: ATP-binding protein [Armatimonadetes bacterium]|nr:ATP-binding protein [Armatimonadota bacterium]